MHLRKCLTFWAHIIGSFININLMEDNNEKTVIES